MKLEMQTAKCKMQTVAPRWHGVEVTRTSPRCYWDSLFAFCILHFALPRNRFREGAGA